MALVFFFSVAHRKVVHLTIVSIFVLIKVVLHYIASLEKLTLKNEIEGIRDRVRKRGRNGF